LGLKYLVESATIQQLKVLFVGKLIDIQEATGLAIKMVDNHKTLLSK